ncbi:MAG: hypothetical protein QXR44_03410 [Thermoproteota archaeon]
MQKSKVKDTGRRGFRSIDNRIIERDIGEVVIECLGRRATTVVVFADERDNEVLGLHALEGLGLEVDPVTKQLKESEAILALSACITHKTHEPSSHSARACTLGCKSVSLIVPKFPSTVEAYEAHRRSLRAHKN